jgi:hypothetical protein
MNVSNDRESEIQNADHILIVLEAISPLKKIPDKSLLNQIYILQTTTGDGLMNSNVRALAKTEIS